MRCSIFSVFIGQVVVNHRGGFLQVETPCAVVGRNQHFAVLFELLDHIVIRAAVVQQGYTVLLEEA